MFTGKHASSALRVPPCALIGHYVWTNCIWSDIYAIWPVFVRCLDVIISSWTVCIIWLIFLGCWVSFNVAKISAIIISIIQLTVLLEFIKLLNVGNICNTSQGAHLFVIVLTIMLWAQRQGFYYHIQYIKASIDSLLLNLAIQWVKCCVYCK